MCHFYRNLMASSAAPKKKRKLGYKKPRKVQARQKITAKQKNMSGDEEDDEDYKDDDSEDPSDLENLLELMDSKVDDVDKEEDEDSADGGDR